MKKLLLAVMLCAVSAQAQVSYWFQGWQRMGNAADAQSYFMMPGANVTFTYANNRVYINSVGGGGGALQLFGDVTSPLTALPNVTATLNNVGAGGTHTKVTWNTKGLVTLGGVATLTTDFTGQGPANQLLHGGGAGNLSWSAVDLASADVTGNLGVTHLAGGVGAAATTFWRGDASWNQINLGTDVTGTLPGSSVSGVWLTAGNTLGAPGTFGSLDGQPINLKVNNVSAGKLDVNGSVAIGTLSTAAGVNATALGKSTTASATTAVAIGNAATASGVGCIAIGTLATANPIGGFALALGPSSLAEGQYSVAMGFSAHAVNYGSTVLNDGEAMGITDSGNDQFVAAYNGGYYFYDSFGPLLLEITGDTHSTASFLADVDVKAANEVIAGVNVYAANNVIASNNVSAHLNVIATNDAWAGHNVVATNGFFYLCQSNSVVPTNVFQPLHTWGCLMKTNTNTIVAAAGTYATITNYTLGRSNQMGCSLTGGAITNTIAGFYHCAVHLSGVAVDNSAYVEGELVLGGVARDEISFQTHFDNPPRTKGMSALGILYIPANTRITFQIKSSGANGVIVQRAQMIVVPP